MCGRGNSLQALAARLCSLAFLLSFRLTSAWLPGQVYTISPEMYIVGDATEAGWNTAKALKMNKDPNANIFRRTMRIASTGNGWKWVRSPSGWSDDCGAMRLTWEKNGQLGHGAKGRVEQIVEVNVPPASATAIYDVVLDMDQGVWSYMCSSECEGIDQVFPMIAPLLPVTVLYTGKVQGALLPTDDTTGKVCTQAAALQPGCSGGLPYIAGYARRLRAQGGSVVLADAGEFFFGGDFYARDQGAAAALLANMTGYDVMSANLADFRGGADVFRNFSAGLGSTPIVLSNGLLPASLQGRRPSGKRYVSGYAAVRTATGTTVGFLGLVERNAEDNIPGLQVNRVRGDVVASLVPNMDALRTEARPDLVVVLNSLNIDHEPQDTLTTWDMGTLTGLVPGIGAILGGMPSVAPLSLSGFGNGVVAYGWMNSYGGKYIQKLDLLLNARGNIVDYNYSNVKLDQTAAQLASNDAVLVKAYDLYQSTVTGTSSATQVGTADVPFFFEGDTSVMEFSQENTPMMWLTTLAFQTLCTDCDLVMVHPSFVNAGLKQGPITTADIERAFPLQGPDAEFVAIEVSGAQLLEALKDLFSGGSTMVALRGARIGVYSASQPPYPLGAVEVANRNGAGYSKVDRSRTYRIGLPRFHLTRRMPARFASLTPVRNLGPARALFETFVRQMSRLTEAHAGGLGASVDAKAFKSRYSATCEASASTDAVWASGCWLAQGTRPEEPDRLGRCPEGSQLDPATLVCQQCPAGTRGLYQATSDVFYSVPLTVDSVRQQPQRCAPCEPGQISAAGQVRCQACSKGTYSDVSGGTSCLPCPPNSVALDPGASHCVADLGFYLASNTFVACPAGRTTSRYGSPSADWCLCKEGSYDAGDGRCLPCPGGMSCPFGSTAQAWLDVQAQGSATSPYPSVLPKFWSSASDPLRTYNCQSAGRCPGGDPGTCGTGLQDRACAHCSSGSWWTGEACKKCTNGEMSRFVYPVVPILVATAVLSIMYKISGDDVELWSAYSTTCTTLVFVALSHYQTLNLLWSANLKMPATFGNTIRSWTFVNNGIDMFKPDCQGLGSFQGTVIAQSVTPLIIGAICLLLWSGSQAASKFMNRTDLAWKADRTFNVFASVMYTFFSGVAAMSLLLFKCRNNPSGDMTLTVDPSVICFSGDDWKSMSGVGIAALIVYCGGMGTAFTWAIVVATTRFRSPSFRACWKCLFIKYRADTWWWSAVFLAKYFFYNILFVASTDPIDQLYWMITITQLYGMAIIMFMPYRVLSANGLEALACTCITYCCAILTDFSEVSNPEALSKAGTAVSFFPLVLTGLLLLWKTYFHVEFRDGRLRLAAIKDNLSETWVKELGDIVEGLQGLSPEAFLNFTRRLGEYDAFVAKKFMVAVKADLFGEHQSFRLTAAKDNSRKDIIMEAQKSKSRIDQDAAMQGGEGPPCMASV